MGGEGCYPFHGFEGRMPHPPRLSLEVHDVPPEEWPPWLAEAWAGVLDNPAAWARKAVEEYGADLVSLNLISTDPNGLDRGPEDVLPTVEAVLGAVAVPVIVWGTTSEDKDRAVLKAVAERFEGEGLILGPVAEGNYKQLAAAALGYGHLLAATSPIDVNLAKQLNILIENVGMKPERMLIDPTTGALGYGLEYTYSVMERIRMAALTQEDEKLQLPIICNVGGEVWKTKEASLGREEAPRLGEPGPRGVLMEAVTAVAVMLAGADIVILNHPRSLELARWQAGVLSDAGLTSREIESERRRPKDSQ
ncbi:MAG: acetyl-CoA decarbonylase/synthase complex subunit delta [Pseudomonadota bacterium]